MTYVRPPDRRDGLRLHFNENTAGCSPAVLEALRSIAREDAGFYPDYSDVTASCERWFGVDPGWVQLTNGLDEGLHVVAMGSGPAKGSDPACRQAGLTRWTPGQIPSVLIVEPAFEMYAACADAVRLARVHIPPEPEFRFPLDAILAAISPEIRVIYLTDPNNPTGLPIPPEAIDRIAAAAPDATVMVDEAYAEFSGRTSIGPALSRQRNIVVGRTFAKAHGLAALRAGALVAHPDTLAPLRRILPPYSLNICAVRALEAALSDRGYLEWYVAESVESRSLIYEFCDRHELHHWRSEANFVLLRIGDRASAVVDTLAGRGVFIRDKSSAPGCAGCVRITAGVADHTRRCLTELEDVLASSAC